MLRMSPPSWFKTVTHCKSKFYLNSCRRKLDSKNEKWLRFEIQYSTECEEKSDFSSSRSHDKGQKHAHPDCLNLSLYDQSDPSNLYLATIDHAKFEKLMNKQNLVIE